MISLAYPWLLALLPLPLLARWLLPVRREPSVALIVPFLDRLERAKPHGVIETALHPRPSWFRAGVTWMAWLCVLLALARPQLLEPPVTKSVPMRDMLLLVDLSGSMETQDFADAQGKSIDRLTAVKQVVADFLAQRKGDRVGLIFFGTAPFVQAPMTEDLAVCLELLNEAQTRMAGPQTAFGDAIGLAITVLDRSEMKQRVVIALTDGNDTSSRVPPDKAAEIAKDKGIVIHTISVGDPKAAGEDALDVETLKQVSSLTRGTYAHAADRGQLASIYRRLDELETHDARTISHRPRRDVYWWPLAAGLIAVGLSQAVETARRSFADLESDTVPASAEERKAAA